MESYEECAACKEEMITAYEFQEAGIDAGLDWGRSGLHCYVFALDKEGNRIAW